MKRVDLLVRTLFKEQWGFPLIPCTTEKLMLFLVHISFRRNECEQTVSIGYRLVNMMVSGRRPRSNQTIDIIIIVHNFHGNGVLKASLANSAVNRIIIPCYFGQYAKAFTLQPCYVILHRLVYM